MLLHILDDSLQLPVPFCLSQDKFIRFWNIFACAGFEHKHDGIGAIECVAQCVKQPFGFLVM